MRYSDKPFMGSVTAPERAEDTFDWNAKPGPAKYAAFMEAFPADKYGGPAYVPTYPLTKK